MAKSTTKSATPTKKGIKLPPLDFGKKQSLFSAGKGTAPRTFVPKTFRITQHKGG